MSQKNNGFFDRNTHFYVKELVLTCFCGDLNVISSRYFEGWIILDSIILGKG